MARRLGVGAGWAVLPFTSGGRGQTPKLPDVMRWVAENAKGRRVAWVDDDLGPDAEAWAARRGNVLLVRTHELEGLTDEQVERLLAWAAG